ncbi:hypothetical protein NMR30_003435 [Vibrio cholerae]|nr:hypothetical protein [Vibrio cholerae]EHK9018663.1 hypothetical protein [Vibrio vulnificus]EHU4998567.1 hypothetical protein [Vibrio vulnificus]EJL6271646.1 hypothetical protein [Vibrio cholerae]EKF9444783.1 hypothetical protein [Vibrio cholerae]
MEIEEFVCRVIKLAKDQGYKVELTRTGQQQINFGHKKLDEKHLKKLYPKILESDAHIPTLINQVAPGRTCTHRPMREIIQQIVALDV